MNEINKIIEKEAIKYANDIVSSEKREFVSNIFKAGANFALSELEHANRWRKVSDELPEIDGHSIQNVLVKNWLGEMCLFKIITIADVFLIKDHYSFWKPID